MAHPTKPPLLAVLIDADNISAKYAEAMFEEIATLGEASIRRIYGDFSGSAPQGWNKDKLAAMAIVPHQQFSNTTGKNSSDIALVIDAMDVMYTKQIDVMCFVSSDCDFTPMVTRALAEGKVVLGFGERKTPAAFVNACSQFLFLDEEKEKTKRRVC